MGELNTRNRGFTLIELMIVVESDLDSDGTLNTWGYVHAATGAVMGLASASGNCVDNGVTRAQDLLNTTGPCRATDGQSVF